MKTILITGGLGFLGKNVAKHYHSLGYKVYGIGHGKIPTEELNTFGFHQWFESSVDLSALKSLDIKPDYILHAGGSGSVPHSYSNPFQDFVKTVDSTAQLLEYIKTHCPSAQLIYPSSPAVQGAHQATPIKVTDPCHPISPYGSHKLMAEQLCNSYSKNFGLKINIIRFFSIYGEGLKKQLLWDASNRLLLEKQNAEFWGTGEDVRDWIHIDDAVDLIAKVFETATNLPIINGASGQGHSVSEILFSLKEHLNSKATISFKGEQKKGDPSYYVAELSESNSLGWNPKVKLSDGLKRYATWIKKELNHD